MTVHTGAISILTKLFACTVHAGSRKRHAALPAQSFPRKCGRRANHPRTISVTHALWFVATHFRIFSDSLSHTNPNWFPQSISQPPLLSHQKFPPLTHSQSRSRVIKPSAHGVGWSCREWSWWGGVMGWVLFPSPEDSCYPATTNCSLQGPTQSFFGFQAKLNNPSNCALEMPTTSVLKPRLK